MDIKEKSVTVCSTDGEFSSPNTLLGIPQEIFSTSGNFKSGKIVDITVIGNGQNVKPKMDLLFFPDKITIEATVGSQVNIPYDILKSCAGRVSILPEDYSIISKCTVANLFNINMTFQYKIMYIVPVYQDTVKHQLHPNSLTINIGYELGVCA